MRNLTIERRKAYAGCAAKMNVYIEDPLTGNVMVSGTPCRKLGQLKNGEQKTFAIEESAARLYVVGSGMERSPHNEYHFLPAGTEDVLVTGKNHLSPATGNPFFFDGVTDSAVLANRKKRSTWGIILIVVSAIIGLVIGSLITNVESPKTCTSQGMSITLTDSFKEVPYEGYNVCYESYSTAVFALKEPFTLAEGFEDLTLTEYLELVITANEPNVVQNPVTENGLTRFEYAFLSPVDNESYHYIAFAYKTEDAFWLVQFAVNADKLESNRDNIMEWAKSVTFE